MEGLLQSSGRPYRMIIDLILSSLFLETGFQVIMIRTPQAAAKDVTSISLPEFGQLIPLALRKLLDL